MTKKIKPESRFVYYKKNMWFLTDDLKWFNVDENISKEMIKKYLTKVAKQAYIDYNSMPKMFNQQQADGTYMLKEVTDNWYYANLVEENAYFKVTTHVDRKIVMSFLNGWLDNKYVWHADEYPFNPSQIKFNYVEKPKQVPEVDEILEWMCGNDENRIKSLTAIATTTLTRINDTTMGIIYSPKGGTGKTKFFSLIEKISENTILRINTENALGKNAEGNKFAITGTKNKTGLLGDELPISIRKSATDMIKDLIDGSKDSRSVEDKSENNQNYDNTIGLVVTTNRISYWTDIDHATKTRIAVVNIEPNMENIPFLMKDENKADFDDQIKWNEEAMTYLLSVMVNNYKEAKKGFRAEGFQFGIKDTENYWTKVGKVTTLDLNDYNIEDIIANSKGFITNEDIRELHAKWQRDNFGIKKNFQQFKDEIVKYIKSISSNYEVETTKPRKVNGKTQNGIAFWLKPEESEGK